ncbi:MAG: siderophore biosynthesis protein SbnG [Candidatus Latescibacteria bacterium]|nr:siderophore biosynthesis protein SbnG [Candidatus Latescibacterota bacterium]
MSTHFSGRDVVGVRINRVKQILKQGGTIYGSATRLPEPGLVEILGYAGFDFVLIDAEHGAMGWAEMERMILAGLATDAAPFVRVVKNEPELVMRTLDLGAMGVMIPHCRTAEDARRFVNGAYYAPRGARGIGPGRGTRWGAVPSDEYFRTIDDQVALLAMVEDPEVVDHIDEIVEVPGIDVLWVGTGDLAAAYGVAGQTSHPKVVEASERILAAGKRKGVAVGFPARSVEDAKAAAAKGYRAIGFGGAESYVMQYARQYLDAVKK